MVVEIVVGGWCLDWVFVVVVFLGTLRCRVPFLVAGRGFDGVSSRGLGIVFVV